VKLRVHPASSANIPHELNTQRYYYYTSVIKLKKIFYYSPHFIQTCNMCQFIRIRILILQFVWLTEQICKNFILFQWKS